MSQQFNNTIKEILTVPRCIKNHKDGDTAYLETPLFYVRVLDKEDDITIQLGEKATFDRWANSVNFFTNHSKIKTHYRPTFLPQYKWAIKVLKSKLFNFSSYFHAIELPWLDSYRPVDPKWDKLPKSTRKV